MKRVISAVLFCAASVAFSHGRAQAMIEFCPASLGIEAVSTGASKDQSTKPAALYGFDLSALGPRSVSATLAFDTSGGWFKIDVPPASIVEKLRHYTTTYTTFTRRDFVSPVMYVLFPQPVTLTHSWVYSANAQHDGGFGWEQQGTVMCDPPSGAKPTNAGRPARFSITLDPKDADKLSSPPPPGTAAFAAVRSQPLETASCPNAFEPATALNVTTPSYPDVLKQFGAASSAAAIVAIDSNGTVADAWIWEPSGYKQMDDETIEAAKEAKYKPARAYCRSVQGSYLFRVTFLPY